MVLMLVSCIPTQCVSQCPLVYIPDGSARKIINESQPAKTIHAHSRAWSFDVLSEFDWIAETEVILLLVDKRQLIVSVYKKLAIMVTLFLKLWDVIRTTVCVKQDEFL